jgi:hypothetical protein
MRNGTLYRYIHVHTCAHVEHHKNTCVLCLGDGSGRLTSIESYVQVLLVSLWSSVPVQSV